MEKIQYTEKLLQRIANHLLLNAGFSSNLGLYHGKMGIIIFFGHYARYTADTLYDDFAGILMEQLYEDIHDKMYFDIEDGLSGIGWGIEYLKHTNFIDGDINDMLKDIDRKIMEHDPLRLNDQNIRTGTGGILHYATYRMQNYSHLDKVELFDPLYLNSLLKVASQTGQQNEAFSIATQYINCMEGKKASYNPTEFLSQLNTIEPANDDITKWELGIENGCAGIGLKIMGI